MERKPGKENEPLLVEDDTEDRDGAPVVPASEPASGSFWSSISRYNL